ncbi:hypothetical protein [Brachyspira pilosicoli]|uniref:hypothetical protein n=1 Tax=Brachyspira pilosicoli TaxID=52584 RepID=UPI000CCA7DC2|nr:hypothetical protein [Brachyspira pilosicoli]PLV63204.1 hypothetical protein BPSP16_04365 [Brachyspira pilosicoli SP16]
MKITVIHGQSHKGSTYNIAKMLYDKKAMLQSFFFQEILALFVLGVIAVLKSQRNYVLIMNH